MSSHQRFTRRHVDTLDDALTLEEITAARENDSVERFALPDAHRLVRKVRVVE
jgi:hypothetical protein